MKKYPPIFLRLFPGKTPLNIILDHVNCIYQVSTFLKELMQFYFDNKEITRFVEQVGHYERKADTIKNELRQLIRKALKISFTRWDLLEFIHIQDNIMDSLEDFAKLLYMNRISYTIDDQIRYLINELIDEVVLAITSYKETVETFVSGFNYGFARPIIEQEQKLIEQLDNIEHKIDTISIDLGKITFSKKDKYNSIDILHFNNIVILLSKIPNSIARLTDKILDFTH